MSIGAPDVREVIRAVKSSRASEADLNAAGISAFVATNIGVVPERLVDVAVRYWSSYRTRSTCGSARPTRSRPRHSPRGSGSRSARAVTALLLDDMLSGVIAEHLRAHGLDAVAVAKDRTLTGTPDEGLFAYAAAQKRALVTANLPDFAAVAIDWRAAGRAHAGLV